MIVTDAFVIVNDKRYWHGVIYSHLCWVGCFVLFVVKLLLAWTLTIANLLTDQISLRVYLFPPSFVLVEGWALLCSCVA